MTTTLATTSSVDSQPTVDLGKLSTAEREKWQLTGQLPEPPKQDAAPEAKKDEKPAEPSTGKQNASEKRIVELKEDIASLSRELVELGGEAPDGKEPSDVHGYLGRRRELRDLLATKRAAQPKGEEKPPVEPPKKDAKAEEKAKPKREEFENADDYIEALTDWKAEQTVTTKLAEREEQTRVAAINKAFEDGWQSKLKVAAGKHADFKEVALNPEVVKQIKPNSPVDVAILHRAAGAELLYFLGQNPEELTRINALNPIDAAFELAAIERKISENPTEPPKPAEKASESADEKPPADGEILRDDKGQFVSKKITDAPPPVPEVGGRASASKDEVAAALERGDFGAYQKLKNAKETAHLQKKG